MSLHNSYKQKAQMEISINITRTTQTGLSLTGILHSGGNTFHGQDKSVFEPRSVLTRGIKRHKLCSRSARIHFLLRHMWPYLHIIARVANPLQCIDLAHIKGCYVCIAKTEPLLQVRVSFQEILVPSNLQKSNQICSHNF